MKKHNSNILFLSLASILGLVGGGCAVVEKPDDESNSASSVIKDELETTDALGSKVALRAEQGETKSQVQLSNSFGYQILNQSENTLSIRIIAVLNGYKDLSSASVKSKVVTPRNDKAVEETSEEVVKAEQTFSVKEVYSSLKDIDNIKWTGKIDSTVFAKQYYIVYTLRDIPFNHAFDTISVTFSATSKEETNQTFVFNANGIIGERTDLEFTKLSTEGDEYYVSKGAGTLSDVITIPEKYFEVTDYYAVLKGTVTSIGNPSSQYASSGAFYNCGAVTEYVLPSSIKTIGAWAFGNNNKLKKINIPENVASIGQSAFYGSTTYTLDLLEYSAKNLINENDIGLQANTVNVSADIESLPNTFFNSGFTITSLNYRGTEAKWDSLKTTQNKYNGFFKIDAVCTDTTYSDVTFHYGSGSRGDKTGDVIVNARNNRTIANPGNPSLAGKEFKGWYLDEAGTNPYDFSSLVTAPFDLYAVYEEPSAGYSFDNPLEINPSTAENFSASLYPGKEFEYIKFSVPSNAASADWYYLKVDKSNCVKDSDISGTSYIDGEMKVYNKEKQEIAGLDSASITNTKNVQRLNSGTDYIRIYANPSDVFYVKARMSSNASQDNYGTIAFSFKTFAQDSVSEALPVTKGTEVTPNIVDTDQKVLYKYVATETKEVLFNKVNMSSASYGVPYVTVKIVDSASQETLVYTKMGMPSSKETFSVIADHTYYIEVSCNNPSSYEASNWFKLSITDVPAGYSLNQAKQYVIGNTETVEPVNLAIGNYEGGAYYTFTVDETKLFTLTTNAGSSSYKNKVVIYKDDKKTKAYEKTTYSTSVAINEDVTLEAGTYFMCVSYDGSSNYNKITEANWGTYTFSLKEVEAGSKLQYPLSITPNLDSDTSLTSTVNGRYYSFVATADNYLVIDTSNLIEDANAEIVNDYGSTLYFSVNKAISFKTTKGTKYILKISGADGEMNFRFSRADAIKNGGDQASAIDFDATNGIMDLTNYVASKDQGSFWIRYAATESNSYKLFFQSFLTGQDETDSAYKGADTKIVSVCEASNPNTKLTAIVNNDDDNNKHQETKGGFSAYAEYSFNAGSTYLIEVKIPAFKTNSTETFKFDTLKIGIVGKAEGDSYDVATKLANINSDTSSLTLQANTNGYWSKFEKEDSTKMTISAPALESGTATISFYKEGAMGKAIATITTGGDSVSANFAAGTYYVCATIDASTTAGSISLSLTNEELPPYEITNVGGSGSSGTGDTEVPTVTEGKEWVDASSEIGEGALKAGCSKTGYGRSVITYTFSEDGTFSFSWACSGEKNWDYLVIKQNDKELVGKTDSVDPVDDVASLKWTDLSIDVKAGDKVIIAYRKDGGGDKGLDCAYIKNINFALKAAA